MGLMILIGDGAGESIMLWLFLVGVLMLTLWECRERAYNRKQTLWWMSFVAITHVFGYVIMRLVRAPRKAAK